MIPFQDTSLEACRMSMSRESSEARLVQRAVGGDATAREQLLADCRRYLHVVARAHLSEWMRGKIDCSDIVQQTLLEAHRGFETFQGTTHEEWLAWLRRIAVHNVADLVRRHALSQKRDARREVRLRTADGSNSSGGVGNLSGGGETPSRAAIRNEQAAIVTAVLADLEPDYQQVIVLRNLQHLSFNEVAEEMGRSRPAVQMLWGRAVMRMRELLAEKISASEVNHG